MWRAFGILEVGALYVAHYLNNAGVFEFNPYEGKTYRELYSATVLAPGCPSKIAIIRVLWYTCSCL